ncbi:MAG TPA: heme-binding protein, partial [Polyangiaceae bacterium]|nr:heme-binding protein [Polyangiaceae bacterium]
GNVPNRGSGTQGDIFLNAVPYVQSVTDVTSLPATGIHFEPGMWLAVPPTTVPVEAATTYARMASIPHGVTINAQGFSAGRTAGKPDFNNPALQVNINPFPIGQAQQPSANGTRLFPSQVVTNKGTARIPQDLTSFVTAGTITQAMLDNPNVLLQHEIASQNIQSFVTLIITTDSAGTQPTPPPNPTTPAAAPVPTVPGFAGGAAEIAFLTGDNHSPPQKPNAHAFKMKAVFWIETVLETLVVPPCQANGLPITIQAAPRAGSSLRPTFTLTPPKDITAPKSIVVPFIQIQYSQTVFLNFNGLTWPHVSVATLIPADPIVVPVALLA